MTGCWARATPAVAVAEGCVWMVNLLAAAALTAIKLEVALVRLPLVNRIVMLVATFCERLVKLTRPLTAVRLVVPCKMPLPAFRLAVTTVVLSLLRRFPNWSSTRTTGWGDNTTPATALAGGWV